ncbi:MAG: DUF305 domain-containing protein [Cyanobium sp.]|nr:DUF305 domain-containing protein [Cyanobium sp.]
MAWITLGADHLAARRIRRRPWLAASACAAAVAAGITAGRMEAAAATGGAPPAPQPSAAPAGQGWRGLPMGQRSADAHFIVMMIPHHEGAIAMADLSLQRSQRPQIRALAERIRTSQSRENAEMRRWYRQWYGSDVPSWPGPGWGPARGMGGGMGMGAGRGMGMPGFATSLEALRTAPDFDRAFLEQMIAHHRMGVMMASHAQWGTLHPELRQLEKAMVQVQSEEIAQMARWYQQWYGTTNR